MNTDTLLVVDTSYVWPPFTPIIAGIVAAFGAVILLVSVFMRGQRARNLRWAGFSVLFFLTALISLVAVLSSAPPISKLQQAMEEAWPGTNTTRGMPVHFIGQNGTYGVIRDNKPCLLNVSGSNSFLLRRETWEATLECDGAAVPIHRN